MQVKKFPTAFLLALFLAFASLPAAEAVQEVVILEVTGILESLAESTLILLIDGQTYGPVPYTKAFEFWNEKSRPIGWEVFARRYLKKKVTVEFYEHNGELLLCRPAR